MTAGKKATQTKQVKPEVTKPPVHETTESPTFSAELTQLIDRRDHYSSVLRYAFETVDNAGPAEHRAAVAYVSHYGALYTDVVHYIGYSPTPEHLKRLLRKEKRIIGLLSLGEEGWEPMAALSADVKRELWHVAIRAKNDAANKRRIQAQVKAAAKVRAEKAKVAK